jgi:hypothetical protein
LADPFSYSGDSTATYAKRSENAGGVENASHKREKVKEERKKRKEKKSASLTRKEKDEASLTWRSGSNEDSLSTEYKAMLIPTEVGTAEKKITKAPSSAQRGAAPPNLRQ